MAAWIGTSNCCRGISSRSFPVICDAVRVGLVLVHDRAERVDRLALQQDVDLDQVGRLLAVGLVVERGVAAGARLQRGRRSRRRSRRAAACSAARRAPRTGSPCPSSVPRRPWQSSMIAPMNSLGARIVARTIGSRTSAILPSGNSLGLVTMTSRAVVHDDVVDDVRRGRDEVEVELALEPLADDLEVQQAEEAAAEAEAERHRRLGLVDQRGVVELELVERLAQVRVVGAVDRDTARRRPSASGRGSRRAASAAGLAALVTVSPTRDWRTSFTPVMR